jgi:hypothetical protein
MGYKGEILLANLVYFMYAWHRDGHIVSLCRVCSSFVYAIRGEWTGKEGTVTLLAYVGFVLHLCSHHQQVPNIIRWSGRK